MSILRYFSRIWDLSNGESENRWAVWDRETDEPAVKWDMKFINLRKDEADEETDTLNEA